MLKFLTSLTFLYAFSITVLLLYGLLYYKSFVKNGYQKRRFPVIFLLVSMACFSFLYFNIHASLKLKTFSNLDHHFIRHDGFRVAGSIELGRNDTINYKGNSFNRFVLSKQNGQLAITSPYSEEPFFAASGSSYKLLSANYTAALHTISFRCDSMSVSLKTITDSSFGLQINKSEIFKTGKKISKGYASWNIFKDDLSFLNSSYYTNEKLVATLKNIMLVRDDVSRNGAGGLKYFLSGRIFQYAKEIKYDEKYIQKDNIAFTAAIADKSAIAWGIGFLDNNRNQFRINYLGADSFALMNRYPVSYPLTEENREDWSKHSVNKFLVSDSKDMLNMPPVFGEGFLFALFNGDSTIDFSPVLLSYQKSKANDPLQLQARFMNDASGHNASGRLKRPDALNNKLVLPAKSSNFGWVFSIQNSFDWNFGKRTLSAGTWQLLLFGTLLFFFLMIFASSWLKPGNKLSWIWQLLTCVTMVLLTTRFFLYWRYKSFPPYEGLDLPSQQQLNSFWNFGIIIFTGIVLAIIFGFGFLRYLYVTIRKRLASLFNQSFYERSDDSGLISEEKIVSTINKVPYIKRYGARTLFFSFWILILIAGGGWAAFNRFDPTTCRHLAIGLTLLYFIFIYISYKHSPLVVSAEKSWWRISTGKSFDIIINNPVKVLLSISLLGLFAFVDMGFAIVFLNFQLFNEAFLCINYAIAGLSAGSKRNASLFGLLGFIYLLSFAINLIYGPYIFRWLLDLPQLLYIAIYILFASRLGSLLAAISLIASPFVVMLWSHESLLCLVAAIAAANCIIRGRIVSGAFLFALATLLRQEALIFMVLSAVGLWRIRGIRPAITFTSVAVAPFLCWSAYAIVTFGTVFSSTMAVKIAMGENGHFEPFLLGLANYMSYCFWLEAPTFWGAIIIFGMLALSLIARLLEKKPLPRIASTIVIGSLITCSIYVAVRSAFFAWFCIPVALVIAVIVALPWSTRNGTEAFSARIKSNLQIGVSVSVIALHFLFLFHLTSGSFADESLVGIFPGAQFRDSGFVALGKFFDRTLAANDSILYPEPGQLRYYSNRTLIDSQGLTHPGVVGYYRTGHPELTIERYRPTVILEDAHIKYPHPSWFDRAYQDRVGPLRFANKTTRSVFRIFLLKNNSAIPKIKNE